MKAKKRAGGKGYRMPIPHERFAHMLTALVGHIQGLDRERSIRIPGFAAYRVQRHAAGEELDEATAREIADALYKLRALYREEWLHTRPNRREKARDLQDAVNAQMLVDLYGYNAASAVRAVAGDPRVERDSVLRTQRNRIKKARLLGVEPKWNAITEAAKRKTKTER